ncbi:MAG: hypothetical protein DHS20C07_31780 [Methyloligella sp.]|nr:MAG: hypothetical protein DHS20C07_31780 [Methyloligella sp.]
MIYLPVSLTHYFQFNHTKPDQTKVKVNPNLPNVNVCMKTWRYPHTTMVMFARFDVTFT